MFEKEKINLKYVAVAFRQTDAHTVLRGLCFECGVRNVQSALSEIAAATRIKNKEQNDK